MSKGKISSINIARVVRDNDNNKWSLREMCEYIIDQIDNGDEGLKNAGHALLIYETAPADDNSTHIWHLAMKANYATRLELIEWHKHFLFKEWEA